MRNAMHRFIAHAGLLMALLIPAAPAPADSVPVRSLLEMRQANVVIQEWDISCGAAALATIFTYQLGHPVSEKQAAQGMLRRTDPLRVKHRGGFSLLDMKRYAESRGYQADGYSRLSLKHLRKLAPLIVPVNLEGYDHFVVFRGMAAGRAVLADPGFGNRTIGVDEFEHAWSGRIGFVVKTKSATTANRMTPRKSDFLAVEDDAVRAAMEADLPPALRDWQMADLPWSGEPAGVIAAQDRPTPAVLSPAETDGVVAGATQVAPLWIPPFLRGAGGAVPTALAARTANDAVNPVANALAPAAETTSTAITPAVNAVAPVAEAASTAVAPVESAVASTARTAGSVVAPVVEAAAPVARTAGNVVAPVADTVATVPREVRTAATAAPPSTKAPSATQTQVVNRTVTPVRDAAGSVTQTLTGGQLAAPAARAPALSGSGGGLIRR